MNVNLLDLLQSHLGKQVISKASSYLGESNNKTKSAMGSILPSILGGLMSKASTKKGAKDLFNMLDDDMHDGSILEDVGGLFAGGDTSDAVQGFGGAILKNLFGNKQDGLLDMVTKSSGIKRSSAGSLLSMAAPIVMGMLGKQKNSLGLDANGLVRLLMGQSGMVQKAAPAGLASLLGFSSFDKLVSTTQNNFGADLGDLGVVTSSGSTSTKATHTSTRTVEKETSNKRAAAATAASTSSSSKGGGFSWMKVLLPLLLLFLIGGFLFSQFKGCGSASQTAENITKKTGELASATGDAVKGAAVKTGEMAKGAASATGDAVKGAASATGDAVKGAAEKTGELASATGDAVKGAASATGKAVKGAAEKTGEMAKDAASATGNAVKGAAETAKDAASATGKAVKGAAEKTGEMAKDAASATGKAVKGAAEKTGEMAKDAASATGKAVKGAAEKTGEAVKATGDAAKGAAKATKNAVKSATASATPDAKALKLPGGSVSGNLANFLSKKGAAGNKAFTLSDVKFASGSANLTGNSKKQLDNVAKVLKAYPNVAIELQGHTDSSGNADKNQQLSERRAKAVKTYLVNKGVATKSLASKGYGSTKPVASNDTQEGKRKNRRTDLVVTKK